MTDLGWQYALVALIVAASAVHLFRKLAPRLAGRWQRAASAWLSADGRSRPARALGRWLRPGAKAAGGCGDGCDTCGNCDNAPSARSPTAAHPLRFHPPRK